MKLQKLNVPDRGRPHPCEREALVNVTVITSAALRNYAFGFTGRRVLSMMATDRWPDEIDNSVDASLYAVIGALRSISPGERKKLREQVANDDCKAIINVFTTGEGVARLIQDFSSNPHSVSDMMPAWMVDRLGTLTDQLGVTLLPRFVDKTYYKVSQLYAFAARIRSDIPRNDTQSPHVLPTQYLTSDRRLTDPVTFFELKRQREKQGEWGDTTKPLTPSYETATVSQ